MYKKILVPIDDSDASAAGLNEAIKLARDQKAILRILHVADQRTIVQTIKPDFTPVDLAATLEQQRLRLVSNAEAATRRRGVKAETVLLDGFGKKVANLIVKQAAKWPADLIVLGTHGWGGLSRLILGSDAEEVIRSAPVPVLVVRVPTNKSGRGKPRTKKKRKAS